MQAKQRLRHSFAEDKTTADRVRSELGPLLKRRDQPHVHVQVTDGIATLHGEVTDFPARAAVEARVLDVAGVHGLRSKLHIGLLPSDTRPSAGRASRGAHGSFDTAPRVLRARDVMSQCLVSVGSDTTIFGAYDAILRHRVHHLPVVAADGSCLALLDVVGLAERMPEAWMTAGETPLWEPAGPAGPLSVLPDTPLREAAAHMDAAGVDACCVVDQHGRLLGLITARDVIAAVAGRKVAAATDGGP